MYKHIFKVFYNSRSPEKEIETMEDFVNRVVKENELELVAFSFVESYSNGEAYDFIFKELRGEK